MAFQTEFKTVFKRYELKYMITREQQAKILKAMEPYMVPDKFGKSTIRNIYFDTDDYILARHSIAKPDFKEKLRIRSYTRANPESAVFVELKRKSDHIVYKRRVVLPESIAMGWTLGLCRGFRAAPIPDRMSAPMTGQLQDQMPDQMMREIDYFLSYYGDLKPAAFISYDRQAYRMKTGGNAVKDFRLKTPDEEPKGDSNAVQARQDICSPCDADFRVTFDENILFRDYDLSLKSDVYGEPLLDEGKVLMELKCSGGIPLWMTEILSAEHIYKTSFSKYGIAYSRYVQPVVAASVKDKVSIAAAPSFSVPNQTNELAPERVYDRAPQRASGRVYDRAAERALGRAHDRTLERTSGRIKDHTPEHTGRHRISGWLRYLGV